VLKFKKPISGANTLRPRTVEADAVRNGNNYMAYFNNNGRVHGKMKC
jgi:hypothetical protein